MVYSASEATPCGRSYQPKCITQLYAFEDCYKMQYTITGLMEWTSGLIYASKRFHRGN